MSINYNTSIPTGHLQLLLDASNRKSYNGRKSLINWDAWTAGSGGVSGYGANGSTVENERLSASDPWGYSNIIWETRPTGTNDADGGWDTSWFNIDRSKLYRYSVWVRRTSSTTGGTFYFGMYANGDGSRRTDNNAVEGNAYWDCRNISWMTQNQWYLVVGHVYPYNTTYTGRHPDSGTYTVSGGRFGDINGCNIGSGDLKWSSNSTQGIHRTYHYYTPDSTSRLQFFQPRVDLIDGTEPTINDLLKNAESTWYDISGNNKHFTWESSPTFTKTNSASYFSTLNNRATGPASNSFNITNGTGYTIITIFNTQVFDGQSFFKWAGSDANTRGFFMHPGWSNFTLYWDQGGCCNADQRLQVTYDSNTLTNFQVWAFRSRLYDRHQFRNGVIQGSTSTYAANINLTSSPAIVANSEGLNWNGRLAYFSLYNTGLDDNTIMSISNSLRGRFGI